jgi:signal transduction histidine kinase
MVDHLLDLSRVEAGQTRLSLGEVDLPGVMGAAVRQRERTAQRRGLGLVAEGPELRLCSDQERVREATLQLIDHALSQMGGGMLHLSWGRAERAGRRGARVQFTHAGDPSRSAESFDGMGLRMARSLLEQVGGTLEARGSVTEGRWSFWVPDRIDGGSWSTEMR